MKTKVNPTRRVNTDDLQNNMRIVAYVEFGKRYHPLDKQICSWLLHNFRGARAIVSRAGKERKVYVNQLLPGDTLDRLDQFPVSLDKLTKVRKPLISELKKREFLSFEVRDIARSKSKKQAKRSQAIGRTKVFLEKVEKSVELRDKISDSIENMVDKARHGKIVLGEIQKYARNISADSLGEAIGAIVSLKKSSQTYSHSVDVAAIFSTVLPECLGQDKNHQPFKDEDEMILGGFIHDIGKAFIPREILESNQRFDADSEEMAQIRNHPEYGTKLLSKTNMSDHIIGMTLRHHVKMDPSIASSYPKGQRYESVSRETRLLSIVDIYQALIGHRSYKRSWTPHSALNFIEQMTGIEHDPDIFQKFQKVIGIYPVGSLVGLSDNTLAFVTNVPKTDLARPEVVIVSTAEGDVLEHHTLCDLGEEKELSIVRDVKPVDVFGDQAESVFMNMQVQ